MAKTMNINLVFSANTQQAKAQLEQLKGSLKSLSSDMSLNRGVAEYNQQLKTAIGSLAHLQAMLNQATTSTGQLDISKFSLSMQKAGMSMEQFRQDLSAFGTAGEEAFIKLSRSVMNGQMPIRQTNMAIDKLWGSMKNVATWQISSKILYGFINQINTAYQYAQDLNESLNNIRIVTGYGADEMSNFADQANKAAKALSTSTLEYTKATQIYFQQGLSGKDVTDRADVTLKLANVARTSGEEASEWMTAIWNNFYDGSKSLEYYADVLTKLGAVTASSSDEIAGGLEKFSAIADTINLSYEYAASALATITADTRQSEEVVGTALKTLFARMEGLKLGDTLDDGTTLNQYSEAMMAVGINIKDANGDLKDMDTILDEMGAKWESLSKAQQVALAESVGGIRQYNQIISLMDNWDVFQHNVEMSKNATGELTRQNDIYAESWEAANKRVKASAEGLYKSLLDDKFFISLTNGTADFLTGITEVIDAMGGLKTLLPGIVLLFNKMFGEKMITGARNMMANISMTSRAAQQRSAKLITNTGEATHGMEGVSAYGDAASGELERTKRINEEINKGKRELTQIEQDEINLLLQKKQIQEDLLQQNAKEQDAKQKEIQTLQNERDILLERNSKTIFTNASNDIKDKSAKKAIGDKRFKKISGGVDNVEYSLKNSTDQANFLKNVLGDVDSTSVAVQNSLKKTYQEYLRLVSKDSHPLPKEIQDIDDKIDTLNLDLEQSQNEFQTMEKKVKESTQHIVNSIKDINADYGFDQAFAGLANGAMSAAMAVGAVQSALQALQSEDATFFDKLVPTLMAAGIILPKLITLGKAIAVVIQGNTEKIAKNTTATLINYLIKNWWITIIAAGVTGLVLMTKAIIDNTKALEEEAKQAKETAQALRTTAQEIKEAYNKMLSTSTEYEEGYKGLEKLTKGTNEYKQALLDTNAKARELIQTQQDLEYSIDENGVIKIDDDSLAKAQNQKYQQVLAADAAATSGEQLSRQLDNEVQAQKILRDNDYKKFDQRDEKNAYLGLGAGAAASAALIGTMLIPGVNVVVASILGGIAIASPAIGAAVGASIEDATTQEYNAIEELKRKYSTVEEASTLTTDEIQQTLEGKYSQDLIDALKEDVTAIQQLIKTNAENNELTLKENQLMVKQQMQANGKYNQYDKKAAEYIANIGGANLEFEKAAIREDMERWGKDGISQIDGANKKAETIAQEYFAAANITGWKLTDTTGDDKDRKFVFEDENGKEQIKSLDEMKEAVINHKALAATAANTEQTAALVAKLRDSDEGNALLDYIAEGNFNNATKTEMDKLKTQTNTLKNLDTNGDGKTTTDELAVIAGSLDAESELENLETEGWGTAGISKATGVNDAAQKVADEYLKAIGKEDDTLTDTSGNDEHRVFHFKNLGAVPLSEMKREVALYRASQGYEDTVDEDIKKWEEQRDAIDDDLYSHQLYNYISLEGKNNLSNDQLKQYKNLMQESSMSLGKSGVELFTELYNSVAVEDKDTFTKAIDNIDWANTTVAEATAQVKDIVDTTSPAWKNYAQQMYKAAQNSLSVAESFDKLRKTIKDIKEIIKDLELGEIISDEDYEKIIEKNKELADSFVRVAEGWRFITDPEQIQKNAFNILGEDFDAALEKAQRFQTYVNTKFKQYENDSDAFYSDISLQYGAEEHNKQNTADAQYDALRLTGAIGAATQGEDGRWYATYTDDMAPLLERANVSKDDYLAAVNEIIQHDSANKQSLQIMELIYSAAKSLYTESLAEVFEEGNVLSVYTDIYDSLSDVVTMVSKSEDQIEDTSKAYDNYIAKQSNSLEISSKELDVMKDQVRGLTSLSTAQKKNATLVGLLAVENKELEKGMISLIENEEDYLKALSSNDLSVITGDLANSVGQVLGNDVDYDFIISNLDIINRLMRGEVEVIDDLQRAYAIARIEASNYSVEIKQHLLEAINGTDYDVEIGSLVDFTNLYNSLDMAGKSLQEIEAEIQAIVGSSFTIQVTKDKDGNISTIGTKIRSNSSLLAKGLNGAKKTGGSNEPEEFDPKRYHKIDEILDDIGKKLDIISEKKNRAFGKDKLEYMNQELIDIQSNLDATQEKLNQANTYYESDKAAIMKYGVELDEHGRIANYDEVRERYYQQYIANPEAYEDSWNKFNEDLDQYEETLNTVEDLEKEQIDLMNKLKDAVLEKIEYTVTFNIESSADKMLILTRALERLDESAYDAADAIKKIGEQTSLTLTDFDTYKQGINDILKEGGFNEDEIQRFFAGDNTVFERKTISQAEVDKLREYRDNLIETENTLKKYRDAVYEQAIQSFEEWNSKLDDNAAKIERCNKLLDEYKNIIDVVGANYLGVDNELLQSISDTRSQLATDAITAAAASFKANQEALATAKKDLDDAKLSGDKDRIKKQQELYDTILKETEATEEELMSALSNAMQVAADEFETAVERAMDTLNEALGNIKELTERFEKQRELEELYLADHKKLYEINKLNRDIQKSIDETDNIKAQRELAKISEEVMAYQANGAEMSKYDLEYLQKRYELKKAEIALEEAQNAKSQVRLQRDAKGNWGYVYTADQKNINKAQENYDKSLYEIQEFEYQSQRELTEQYLDLQQKMMDELAALRASDFENAEEYEVKRQEIINHYTQMAKGVLGEIQSLTHQSAIVNKKYNLEMADTFEETLLGRMYPTYDSFEEMTTVIDQAIADSMDALGTAYSKWEFTVDTAFNNAGISAETFANYMEKQFIPKIQKTSTEAADEAKNLANQFIKYFIGEKDSAINAVRDFETRYGGHMTNIRQANDLTITSISGVSSAAGEMAKDISRIVGETNGYISDLKQNLKAAQGLANDIHNLSLGSTIESKTEYVLDTGDNVYDGIDGKYYRDNNGNWYHESDVTFGAQGTDGRHITFSGSGIGVSGNIRDISKWEAGRGTTDIVIEPIGQAFVEVAPHIIETYELMSDGNLYKLSDLANETFHSDEIQYVDFNLDIFSASPSILEELKIPYPSSGITIDYYDTGGYTGEWGSDGRLAMLHQKEIVLNAHDTENFLSAVKIVRSMSDMLEHNANVAMRGLNLEHNFAHLLNNKQPIDQNVKIEAHFPNVTDRYEIEQAFNSLVNDAAQQANRN